MIKGTSKQIFVICLVLGLNHPTVKRHRSYYETLFLAHSIEISRIFRKYEIK